MTLQMRLLLQPIPVIFVLLMVGLSQVSFLASYWAVFFYCSARLGYQVLIKQEEPHYCVGNNLGLCAFILPILVAVDLIFF